jgi:alkanesulfonate monooxygenase SsuD/methylene tetrahydromethanopterin reductase-like flavin-dependent oxidoreductase (luciferase family)
MWAICAGTNEEALRLSASMRMTSLMLFRGQLIAIPPVEKALEFLKQEGLPMEMLPAGRRILTGSPASLRPAMEAVAEAYGAGEILAVNIMHDHAARRRSYELLAEAFDLKAF